MENYRSRAAFKLLEAQKKFKFIKNRDVVVDLGSAPGSWIQVSRKIVGSDGYVLSVSLDRVLPFDFDNIFLMEGNIEDSDIIQRIKIFLPRLADVVISDLAPKMSGIWEFDQNRQLNLAEKSFEITKSILKKKGNFFVKIFQGKNVKSFLNILKKHFYIVKMFKPRASRSESAEIYIVGLNYQRKLD